MTSSHFYTKINCIRSRNLINVDNNFFLYFLKDGHNANKIGYSVTFLSVFYESFIKQISRRVRCFSMFDHLKYIKSILAALYIVIITFLFILHSNGHLDFYSFFLVNYCDILIKYIEYFYIIWNSLLFTRSFYSISIHCSEFMSCYKNTAILYFYSCRFILRNNSAFV